MMIALSRIPSVSWWSKIQFATEF